MKRKRVVLSLENKIDIVNRLKNGESELKVAADYDIGRTTVIGIRKDADKLLSHVSTMTSLDGNAKKRKTMKSAYNEELDAALYLWFLQNRSLGIPMSGPILTSKALELNKQLKACPLFTASNGWLEKFKHRHGIRQLDVVGEKLDADKEIIPEFQKKIQEEIKMLGLSRDQVFNGDESGLFWKAFPKKTLAAGSEKNVSGYKMKKDRVTIMVCANASGSFKLPLAVIGKSKHPRAYPKNFDFDTLPVRYLWQERSWMTEKIFIEWFHKDFVPKVTDFLVNKGLEPKAMLLVDNAPAHGFKEIQSSDGKIKLYFLPPNTTAIIQPMDQGVIESLKRSYRKSFVENLLRVMAADKLISVDEFWKSYNIRQAITNVAAAWDSVTQSNLANAWNKLWPSESMNDEQNNDSQPNSQVNDIRNLFSQANTPVTEEDVSSWISIDSDDYGFGLLTDDEIVQSVLNEKDPDSESEEEEEENNNRTVISNAEAEEMICKYLEWYENRTDSDLTTNILLRKLCTFTSKLVVDAKKQTTIDDYL